MMVGTQSHLAVKKTGRGGIYLGANPVKIWGVQLLKIRRKE